MFAASLAGSPLGTRVADHTAFTLLVKRVLRAENELECISYASVVNLSVWVMESYGPWNNTTVWPVPRGMGGAHTNGEYGSSLEVVEILRSFN